MPVVIYAPHKNSVHDGSLVKQIHSFIRKLFEDDTLPGLHIEPINASVDPKVRTGRVNSGHRAVLFKVQAAGGPPHYIYTGVWPHDEAIKVASKAVLKTNPVNGLPELIMASEVPLEPAPRPTPAAPAPQAPPLLTARSHGLTRERMIDEVGLDASLVDRALAAQSEDEIMELAEIAIDWQGMALLDLAAGKTVEDVLETLGVDDDAEAPPVEDSEEALLAGLRTPVARMQFAWLEDDEELRNVIEAGDFARWRTFLHPEQRRYAERSYNGAFRLSGGAGTGKTVVLLHRARMLARRDPAARVVLTTFTRNLAEALQRDLRLLDDTLPIADGLDTPGVFVTGVDAAASKVLAAASPDDLAQAIEVVLGIGGNSGTRRTTDSAPAWRAAIDIVGSELPVNLRSPGFFAAEYSQVVLPKRVASRDAYLRVRRPGRGVALGRSQRGPVWDVISAYRSSAAVEGTLDFAEVCAVAAALRERESTFPADHVLIDEGQDLSPPQWQFLRSLVTEGTDDLFIAEDAQQRIYGQHVVLSRYGIAIRGRSRRLSLNYRTTQQVLDFATSVLAGTEYTDLDDGVANSAGYRSARRGPAPERIAAPGLDVELDRAATAVQGWLDGGVVPETIGILARDRQMVETVTRGLEDRGVRARQVSRSATTVKDPQVMTMHRAKGMEFSRVLIFGVNADLLPASYVVNALPEEEREDVAQRERALFYVAATRARDELVVMWEGKGSEFLAGQVAGQ